jgi:hypothetical protein
MSDKTTEKKPIESHKTAAWANVQNTSILAKTAHGSEYSCV